MSIMSTPRNSDSGWGIMDGQSCYWDTNEENGTTNIFPDGMPRNRHDHEHIVVDSDNNVVYWRDKDGTVIIDSDSDSPIRY